MNTASRNHWLAINFAATIFVSAFLLFQVQPLVSKFILPWFGGTPAVWTTCMLFFQTLLFAGYAYAHFSATWLKPKQQAAVHLVLMIVALALLKVVPGNEWKPADSLDPVGQIIKLLAFSVGLPFFVLSSTGPLLQSWFARTYPDRTPYRLYALSNFGSLLALLSYPLFFERVFAINGQKIFWSCGFIAYAALCGYAAVRLWMDWRKEGSGFGVQGSGGGQLAPGSAGGLRNAGSKSAGNSNAASAPSAAKFASDLEITAAHLVNNPGAVVAETQSAVAGELVAAPPENRAAPISSWWRAILWLVLPAFASITLLATTNHVCTDICVMPLLWVVPLALYLLTFIIAFDSPRWYRPIVTSAFTILAIYLVMAVYAGDQSHLDIKKAGWPGKLAYDVADTYATWHHVDDDHRPSSTRMYVHFAVYAAMNFAAMFGICLLCHGELVRSRPESKHLTAFYLLISAGGALGGMFATLIAPRIFITYLEWNISLVAGYGLALIVTFGSLFHSMYGGSPWLQYMLEPLRQLFTVQPQRKNTVFSLSFAWLSVAASIAVLVAAAGLVHRLGECFRKKDDDVVLYQVRNFFGTLTVKDEDADEPEIANHLLSHGRITHGMQFTDEDKRHIPTTYYAPESGVGRTVGYFRQSKDKIGGVRIGAVGLGTGTMAAYVDEGDSIHFYDINPDVIQITTSGKYFTYLKDAKERGGKVDVTLGDARLSLEREAKTTPQHYHVLVLDAFSGDAIPVHLLTAEAVETYLQHLATPENGGEDGALAVHITNRYVDLEPICIALAEKYHLGRAYIANETGANAMYSSDWIILTRNQQLLKELNTYAVPEDPTQRDPKEEPKKPLLWTDDYSSLIDALR